VDRTHRRRHRKPPPVPHSHHHRQSGRTPGQHPHDLVEQRRPHRTHPRPTESRHHLRPPPGSRPHPPRSRTGRHQSRPDHPGLSRRPRLRNTRAVITDIARQVAATQPKAERRYAVTNNGQVVHVGTTRKRPTTTISRHVQTHQPVCSFPGCRVPAQDCDHDHLTPRSEGGQTTTTNLGPKMPPRPPAQTPRVDPTAHQPTRHLDQPPRPPGVQPPCTRSTTGFIASIASTVFGQRSQRTSSKPSSPSANTNSASCSIVPTAG